MSKLIHFRIDEPATASAACLGLGPRGFTGRPRTRSRLYPAVLQPSAAPPCLQFRGCAFGDQVSARQRQEERASLEPGEVALQRHCRLFPSPSPPISFWTPLERPWLLGRAQSFFHSKKVLGPRRRRTQLSGWPAWAWTGGWGPPCCGLPAPGSPATERGEDPWAQRGGGGAGAVSSGSVVKARVPLSFLPHPAHAPLT